MRKSALVLAILFVAVLLCGCDFREPDRQYIAAALGFDSKGQDMQISVEAVVINSESNEEEIKTEIFSAQGGSPEECFYNLGEKLAKKMSEKDEHNQIAIRYGAPKAEKTDE